MTVTDPYISAEKQGVLGLLTVKRPAALNALNTGMVRALDAALAAWATDDAVAVVAIRGEGPRAFCAGGDIRVWVTEGPEAGLAFLAAEYQLNHRIATYAKPVVAFHQLRPATLDMASPWAAARACPCMRGIAWPIQA